MVLTILWDCLCNFDLTRFDLTRRYWYKTAKLSTRYITDAKMGKVNRIFVKMTCRKQSRGGIGGGWKKSKVKKAIDREEKI